ncbi:MAG: gyrase subunit, partial [Actinomycetota bacterium]
ERFLFFVTKQGQVKKTAFDAYNSSRRDGLIALSLKDGDELVRVIETAGDNDIFIVSHSGQVIRFSEKEVRPMGRTAAGVRGMKLKAGDYVISADAGKDEGALLIVSDAGYAKRTQNGQFPRKGRGTQGVIGVKITSKKGHVVAAFMVGIEDEIVAVASNGVTIRTEVKQISSQGRAATGVRLMNLDDGAVVASVAPILSADDD